MISRRALARALGGMKTGSLARADRRGKGPGTPIKVSATLVCYLEDEVSLWLRARGLEWADGTVRPIKNERAAAATAAPHQGELRHAHTST